MNGRDDNVNVREYLAIVWNRDESRPGERVTIRATSLDEARTQIEAK